MGSKNKLYVHDNLDVLYGMNSASVDLIYLDPPFNSKRIYAAPIGSEAEKKAARKGKNAGFHDIWVWDEDVDVRLDSFIDKAPNLFTYIDVSGDIYGSSMKAYLTFMAQRIIELHRLLKDSGSFYLHCDPTASHYLKLILDEVFGRSNFRNEIVWCYTGPSAARKNFSRKHDTILRYSKSNDWVFNEDAVRVPYKELHTDSGTKAKIWGEEGKLQDEEMRKIYLEKGKVPEDYWTDIPSGGHISPKERTGYPTQKPLKLLDRIIRASSVEGDMVLDPFCGCATTCVAAQNLHRNWIGIDVSEVAADLVSDRLSMDEQNGNGQKRLFTDFEICKSPPVRTDLAPLKMSKDEVRKHFFVAQDGKCNGCGTQFDSPRHFHIDHIYPQSKGGAWQLENLQLLCGNCNAIKGNRPMEYLLARIKRRNRERYAY